MSTIVAFVSQKGGVGKSTLSRAIAREAAAGGLTVKIADLDTQQGTCVDWTRRRLAAQLTPAVPVEPFGTAQQALQVAPQYDLLVIDAPARTSAGTLAVARVADLVVQPSGASLDDLRPAVKEFHALVKEGIAQTKLVFALNRIGTETEESEAREYLTEAGFTVLAGYMPEKTAYRNAQNAGRAVTETTHQGLNAKADTLIQTLIDRIGEEENGEPRQAQTKKKPTRRSALRR